MPLRAKKATAGGERVRIQWELEGILAAANVCGLLRAVRRVGLAPPPYERCYHPDGAPRPGFARRVYGGELSVGWGLPHRRITVAITRTVRRGAPYGRLFAIEKSPSPAGWSPQRERFGEGRRSAGARSPAFAASVVFIAVSGSPYGWRGLPRQARLRGWLRPVSGGRAYCARCLRSPRGIPSQ